MNYQHGTDIQLIDGDSTLVIHAASNQIFTGLCRMVKLSDIDNWINVWEGNKIPKLKGIRMWLVLTSFITKLKRNTHDQ